MATSQFGDQEYVPPAGVSQFGDREEVQPITGGDLVRSALGGATLGWGDEMRAAASAALGAMTGQGSYSDLYDVTKNYENEQSARFARQHPGANLAAEIAGGGALGVLGGMKAAGTAVGKEFAKRVATQGMWGRMATASMVGAGTGGAGGAVAGAGHAPEMADIPGAAAKGALWGTAAGAALGPVAEGVMTAGRAGMNTVRRAMDPEYQAAKNVARANSRADMTSDEALEVAGAMGPQSTLAESSIPHLEMLETMTQQPGPARDMAMRQLTRRSETQGGQLLSDFGPGRKHQTVRELKKFKQNEASPIYERSFNQGVPHTQVLEDVFNDLEQFMPGLWAQAKKLGQLAENNAGRRLAPDAMGTTRPSLRGWQYMKEQLDDRINALYKNGNAKEASALKDTRQRLLDELDVHNKDYAQARQMWSSAAQFEDMMGLADRFMSMSASQFDEIMHGISRADRAAIRIGAVEAMEARIERGQWTQDVAKFFRTPAMQRKIRLLFDNDSDYAAFLNKVRTSTRQQQTYDAVRGNSATARRLAAAAESNDFFDKLMQAASTSTTPAGAARTAARAIGQGMNRMRPSRSEAARTATAQALLEPNALNRHANQQYMNTLMGGGRPALPGRQNPALVPGAAGGILGSQSPIQPQYSPQYQQLGNGAAGFWSPFEQRR